MALRTILLCLFLLLACKYSENEGHRKNSKRHVPVEDGLIRKDYTIQKHHNRQKRAVAATERDQMIFLQVNIPGSFDFEVAKRRLNNLTYPIQLHNEILPSISINITEIVIITACKLVNEEIQCSCDSEFQWNSTFCNKYEPCDLAKDNCSCIKLPAAEGAYCDPKHQSSTITSSTIQTTTMTTSTMTRKSTTRLPTSGQTTKPTPTKKIIMPTTTKETTTTTTTTLSTIAPSLNKQKGAIKLKNKIFTESLRDPSSNEFKELKAKMEETLTSAYKNVKGFSSVIVRGFSEGSVDVFFDLFTEENNEILPPDTIINDFKTAGFSISLFKDKNIPCYDPVYGKANYTETKNTSCPGNQNGIKNRTCLENGTYGTERNFCLLSEVSELLKTVENSTFVAEHLGDLLKTISNTSKENTKDITEPGNLIAVVNILSTFSNLTNVTIDSTQMEDFLDTVSAVIGENSTESWNFVSDQHKGNEDLSSQLLKSVETFTTFLPDNTESFTIKNENIQLEAVRIDQNNPSHYNVSFADFINSNLTGNVFIDKNNFMNRLNTLVVSVGYPTLLDILSSNSTFDNNHEINSLVITTTTNKDIETEMTFSVRNESLDLDTAICAFWNFSLFDGNGGWDNTGCTSKRNGSYVVCNCNHLTSFSILMSPYSTPELPLKYITYIGVAVSMGSLVISIIIEAMVWKHVTKNKTSYTRHLAILNIAISLLVADIWFIIGVSMKPNTNGCIAATFFIHFFYLALFFWMLTLGLLLVYRLVFVFHDHSRTVMRKASLALGYLCPLIIAAITIGVAHPSHYYTRSDVCWLGWKKNYPLLAFIIPVLMIITINAVILIIVIFKLLRKTVGDRTTSQTQERDTFKQIVRSVAILTPILGLTWGFGIPTFQENSPKGFHYVFAILNSFQGFFILVFAILMDSKVREALLKTFSLSGFSSRTKPSQSTTTTKPPLSKPVSNILGKKGHYSMARQFYSSDFSNSQSYSTLN